MVPSIPSGTINGRHLLRLSSVLGLALLAALVLGRPWPATAAGSAIDSKPTAPQVDLSVIKATAWITGINVITYTITYSNTGPSDAREVFVTDTLPVSLTYQGQVSATPAIEPLSPIGQAHTWYTPTLPANTTGSIVYTVTINTGITATLTNSVSITTTTDDINPGNNLYQTGVNVSNGTPLGVILASFDARSITSEGGDHNVIAWETASELNMLGFNLWRGTSASAPMVKLNSFVIPSQAPGGTDGATYGYDDLDITSGLTYYYWLEDVELNGTVTRHGPAVALGDIPTAVTLTDLQANSRATNLPWPMLGLLGAMAALVMLKRRSAE